VRNGAKFCSPHCEAASKDVARHDLCDRGHTDCTDWPIRSRRRPTGWPNPAASTSVEAAGPPHLW